MKKFNISKGLVISLLTLALCLTCFAAVKVSAAAEETAPEEVSAVYVPETDSIKASAKAVAYVLKAASGNKIKAGSTAYSLPANREVSLADLGIKGTKADVYIHIVSKEYTTDKDGAAATLTIKGQAAKKITGIIDYTKADAAEKLDNSDNPNPSYYQVLSATCVDSNKKEITEPTPVIYWSTDANGKFYKASLDDADLSDATLKKNAFTSKQLRALLESGGTIYIKQLGTTGEENVRTSSAVKVKIAKQGKAVSVKLDVKKGTLSLKNGYDFGLAIKSGSTYNIDTWYTILPVLNGAATKTLDDSIVATANFIPVDKKASTAKLEKSDDSRTGIYLNKVSYTSYKFKSVSLEKVAEKITKTINGTPYDLAHGFTLAVRKSATVKAPASAVAYFQIAAQSSAPLVITESKVADQYIVSSGDNFDKGISFGEVKNYPGTITANNETKTATSGYWNTFKIEKATDKNNDANPESYEFAIVKAENLIEITANSTDEEKAAQIDLSTVSWKKFDPAKTKITSKLKTKYSTMGGSSVEATLNAIEVEDSVDLTVSSNLPHLKSSADDKPTTYLLIRRAGVKGKTAGDSVVASDFAKVYVVKQDKTFYIMSTGSVGAEAVKYTINFAKFAQETADGTAIAAPGKFTVTNSVEPIVGWLEKGKTLSASATDKNLQAITLPAFTDGVYVLKGDTTAIADSKKDTSLEATAGLTSPALSSDNKKLTFTMASNASGAQTYTVIMREYANVKVVAKYSVEDGDTAVKDLVLVNWVKGVDKSIANNTTANKFVGDDVAKVSTVTGNKISFPANYTLKAADTWTAISEIDVPENAKLVLTSGVYEIAQIASGSVEISIPVELKQQVVKVVIDAGENAKFADLPDGWTLTDNDRKANQEFRVTLKSGSDSQLQVKITLPAAAKATQTTTTTTQNEQGEDVTTTTTKKGSSWKASGTTITSPYTPDISNTNQIDISVAY